MTSWEDVINQVVIPGDGQAIRNAKGAWEVVLGQTLQAKDILDVGLRDLVAWKGEAGETYRTNIGKIAKMLGDIHEQSKGIVDPLGTSATQMDNAISSIQIPAECIHDVAQAKEVFVNTDALAGMPNGYIFSAMSSLARSDVLEGMLSLPGGGMVKGLRNWISGADDHAIDEYERLNNNYGNNAVMMPVPADVMGGVETDISGIPEMPHIPPGGGVGGLPGTGVGDLPTTSFDPSTSATGLDDFGTGTTDLDTGGLPGSGLAGAGGGGLTGAGLDGLGSGRGLSGAGLGGGLGGAGSGLGGAGLPRIAGLGPAVSPGMPMGGMMGGGAGAGGRGGGRGGGARTGMMGGAPMGGHGAGGEDDHGTWLQEDEDVWGTDTGAAPPLLT